MICINGYARSETASGRSVNEDNFCINRHFNKPGSCGSYSFQEKHDTLLGVFGGIGGEMASFIPAKTLARFDGHLPGNTWDKLLNDMNHRLKDFAQHNGLREFGSSAAIASVKNGMMQLCMLGKCEAYIYRDGNLKCLHKNIAENGNTEALKPCFVNDIELTSGDYVMLCSNGLSSAAADDVIKDAMKTADCRLIADDLIKQAMSAGIEDDISLIVFACEKKTSWFSSLFR